MTRNPYREQWIELKKIGRVRFCLMAINNHNRNVPSLAEVSKLTEDEVWGIIDMNFPGMRHIFQSEPVVKKAKVYDKTDMQWGIAGDSWIPKISGMGSERIQQ